MAMDRVASTYVHSLTGRLRIKLAKIKRASREALEVELRLQQISGVDEVFANPLTGNVLILYSSRLIAEGEITAALREWGYLSRAAGESDSPDPGLSMASLAKSLTSGLMEAALFRLVSALL
jgi:hypothetical protein